MKINSLLVLALILLAGFHVPVAAEYSDTPYLRFEQYDRVISEGYAKPINWTELDLDYLPLAYPPSFFNASTIPNLTWYQYICTAPVYSNSYLKVELEWTTQLVGSTITFNQPEGNFTHWSRLNASAALEIRFSWKELEIKPVSYAEVWVFEGSGTSHDCMIEVVTGTGGACRLYGVYRPGWEYTVIVRCDLDYRNGTYYRLDEPLEVVKTFSIPSNAGAYWEKTVWLNASRYLTLIIPVEPFPDDPIPADPSIFLTLAIISLVFAVICIKIRVHKQKEVKC